MQGADMTTLHDLPPLPWSVADKWDERTNGCLILDANGQAIASVLYRGGTGVPRMTAEKIVKCAALGEKA